MLKELLRLITIVAVFLLLLWILNSTVAAILASPAPDAVVNGLARASDNLGDLLCKVMGL